MARQSNDTWNLATSVGATATMAAAGRATASRSDGGVVNDPFAEPLVRAVGIDFFSRLASGDLDFADVGTGWLTDFFAVRARYFDDFLTNAWQAGVRQAVNVASGLDSRAYRLGWPAGSILYEIDRPEVIDFKSATLTTLDAVPTTVLRPVMTDLREDWRAALRAAGFDPAQPTAWLLEGLLIGYLPTDAQDHLLNDITELSAPGSRFAADYVLPTSEFGSDMRTVANTWREHGLDVDLSSLFFEGQRTDVANHLQSQGWESHKSRLRELYNDAGIDGAAFDLVYDETAAITYVTATRRHS
ncbi:MAG TPA: class I SAM-dependent methyltransferase [Nitrolancea sp.]|jgi:methyltransferase (TIGR00027 family)|nr:class I SAM-dependent methyltransferase [Nitrolancea sp.]